MMRVLATCAMLCLLTAGAVADESAELRQLIDRIASGQDADGAAADELLSRLTEPLAKALKDVEKRPLEEQTRVSAALSRLHAVFRVQIYRLQLVDSDREAFDAIYLRRPALVEGLFAEDAETRNETLESVPLKPNSGAGLLITACVGDPDGLVSDHALAMARELGDDVVVRCLTRRIAAWTTSLKHGYKDPRYVAYEAWYADLIFKCAKIVGAKGTREQTPVLLDALDLFLGGDVQQRFASAGDDAPPFVARPIDASQFGDFAVALGDLGDERAASRLERLLSHDAKYELATDKDGAVAKHAGQAVWRTVSDVALLALLRVYELDPRAFGAEVYGSGWRDAGWPNEEGRRDAQRKFVEWRKANADKPAAEREKPAAPASQPADEPQ